MKQINENDQWLLNGECNKCRRQNYCSKRCNCNKRKTEMVVNSFISSKLNEMTNGVYGEIMKHSIY